MCPAVFLCSCLVCCRHDADISADFSQDVNKSAEIKLKVQTLLTSMKKFCDRMSILQILSALQAFFRHV